MEAGRTVDSEQCWRECRAKAVMQSAAERGWGWTGVAPSLDPVFSVCHLPNLLSMAKNAF